MSGFSGRGSWGGGAGGWENGEVGFSLDGEIMPFVLGSACGFISGGGFGNSCPGSEVRRAVKKSLVRCRSWDCCLACLSSVYSTRVSNARLIALLDSP